MLSWSLCWVKNIVWGYWVLRSRLRSCTSSKVQCIVWYRFHNTFCVCEYLDISEWQLPELDPAISPKRPLVADKWVPRYGRVSGFNTENLFLDNNEQHFADWHNPFMLATSFAIFESEWVHFTFGSHYSRICFFRWQSMVCIPVLYYSLIYLF